MQLAPMRYTKIDGTAVAVSGHFGGQGQGCAEGTATQEARAEVPAQRAGAASEVDPQHGEGRFHQEGPPLPARDASSAGVWLLHRLVDRTRHCDEAGAARPQPRRDGARVAPHRRDAAQHRRLHLAARRQDADAAVTARARRYSWCCTTPVRLPPGRSVIGMTCGARTDAGPPISTCRQTPNTVSGHHDHSGGHGPARCSGSNSTTNDSAASRMRSGMSAGRFST